MKDLLEFTEKKLAEKLAENIVALDTRSVSPFTDYFVIATAKNVRHADGLASFLMDEARKEGFDVRMREGDSGSNWILVDFYSVIVHIFTEDARNTYRLEKLWADLPMEFYKEETLKD